MSIDNDSHQQMLNEAFNEIDRALDGDSSGLPKLSQFSESDLSTTTPQWGLTHIGCGGHVEISETSHTAFVPLDIEFPSAKKYIDETLCDFSQVSLNDQVRFPVSNLREIADEMVSFSEPISQLHVRLTRDAQSIVCEERNLTSEEFNASANNSTSMKRRYGSSVSGEIGALPFQPGGIVEPSRSSHPINNATLTCNDMMAFDAMRTHRHVSASEPWLSTSIHGLGSSCLSASSEVDEDDVIGVFGFRETHHTQNDIDCDTPHSDLLKKHLTMNSQTSKKLKDDIRDRVDYNRCVREDADKTHASTLNFSSLFGEDDKENLNDTQNSLIELKDNLSVIPQVDTIVADTDNITDECDDILGDTIVAENNDKVLNESGRIDNHDVWAIDEPLMRHEDIAFEEAIPNQAIQYPFELDPFQKQAIMHLEKGESVFVAAHTSAGKTVVAEYAVALASRNLTRAIYTSPIKTLSNQKFREFKQRFGEVGLITGDVQINPDANCLIVTTEILRSMLYRGADVIRDIEWVIFDEIHYINNVERGVVWEEVIIMLPKHVNVILLSATVPNPLEFADWVGRTKQKRIFVISTTQRPVPLQHYLWCSNTMHNIKDVQGRFIHAGFTSARMKSAIDKKKHKIAHHNSTRNEWIGLLNYVKKRELLPCVVFSFSKRRCESSASGLASQVLTSANEKSEIHLLVQNALKRLHKDDRKLPQIIRVAEMMRRGIAMHHSGLLPIVKEFVEMAFARGLIKILFATETFAMGVNMPTRTVVFNGLRKHDGSEFRDILPGEYTQMSGRAGRRGLDSFGSVVIHCVHDEVPDETTVRNLLMGKATKLQSRFRLTYNMVLNLLRVEDLRVEDMIKRSFSEFSTQKNESTNSALVKKGQNILSAIEDVECIYNDPTLIHDYFTLCDNHEYNRHHVHRAILLAHSAHRFICSGRILMVSKYNIIEAKAVIIDTRTSNDESRSIIAFICCPMNWKPSSSLVKAMERRESSQTPLRTLTSSSGRSHLVCTVLAENIVRIGKQTVTVDTHEIIVEERQHLIDQLSFQIQAIESVIELHPIRDMKLKDIDFVSQFKQYEAMEKPIVASKCHDCPKRDEHYEVASRVHHITSQVERLKFLLSDDNVELLADMQQRIVVLQELKYIDSGRALLLKGRVACEVSTCDSLIITEMVFDNVLAPLHPALVAALLSCLIFQGKSDDVPELNAELSHLRDHITNIARSLSHLQLKCGVDTSSAAYLKNNINPSLMQVVYEWAKGTSFAAICELTLIEEGSIVRCIVRLVEACRDVRNMARVIGDRSLFTLMEKTASCMKRDIVFAASLYVA